MTAIPHYLRPKDTKLPEGHDDTLDPPEAPTDPARRTLPPSDWPTASRARGGVAPPDAPLAPPPTDPARRGLAPFEWPNGGGYVPNRAIPETMSPLGDLDPDIAMWPRVAVNIWPFAGPPTVGIWPKGWIGIDNVANMYICSVGGQPGTWTLVATGTTGVGSFNGRTGAVVPIPGDYLAVPIGGLTGATIPTRYVGGTTAGAPTTGTFAVGDFVIDGNQTIWTCATAGTPGIWNSNTPTRVGRMYNSSQVLIQNGMGNVTVNLMAQDFVRGGITFNSGAATLVVNQTGIYQVSWSINYQAGGTAPVGNAWYTAGVLQNGTAVRQTYNETATAQTTPTANGSDILQATAGDTFALFGSSSWAAAASNASPSLTYLSLELVGT